MTTDLPAPGVYENIPAATYHSWPYCSASRLGQLESSTPAHVQHGMRHPKPPTEAQRLGTILHTAIFEPAAFTIEYVRGVEGNRNTKAVKEAEEEIARWNPGCEVLKPATYDQVLEVQAAVLGHSRAKLVLGLCERRELSLVWDDPATGVRCKARIDAYGERDELLVDGKSTTNAHPEAWAAALWNLGYHRQPAMYMAGLNVLGLPCTDFAHLIFEKEGHIGVAVRRLEDGAIDQGRKDVARLLKVWAECEQSGAWPSYSEAITEATFPPYIWDRIYKANEYQEASR
jgi:hypothetical protein